MNFRNLHLRTFFSLVNRARTIEVPREKLAAIITPFLKDQENNANRNDLIEGFHQARDWLRIGFMSEKEKGTRYEILQDALAHIIERLNLEDPEKQTLTLDKKQLRYLKISYFQLLQAAMSLSSMANRAKAKTDEVKLGWTLDVRVTLNLHERPYASRHQYAQKLEDLHRALECFFEDRPIPALNKGKPQLKLVK